MTTLKLKEFLDTNVPFTLYITKRGGSYPNKYREGEMQYLYVFRDDGGNEYTYYCNEREQGVLKDFPAGEKVIVTRKEAMGDKGRYAYLDFTAPGDLSLQSKPQMRSNTAEDTLKRKQEGIAREQRVKEKKIMLFALMKAWIPVTQDNEIALLRAQEGIALVEKRAEALTIEEDIKVTFPAI